MRESGRIYIIIVHDNFTCSIMYSYTHTHTQAETTPPSVPHHDYGNIASVVMEVPSLCVCVCECGEYSAKSTNYKTQSHLQGRSTAQKANYKKQSHMQGGSTAQKPKLLLVN